MIQNIIINNFHISNLYKVLNLGAGDCRRTIFMKKKNKKIKITNLDVAQYGVICKSELYDGENIPYRNNYFDLGLCILVLHHAEKYEKLLLELARTCKYAIILEDIPHYNFEWFFCRKHSNGSKYGSYFESFHSKEEWIDIIRGHHFEIIKKIRISRWYYPFCRETLLYPVSRMAFVCKSLLIS